MVTITAVYEGSLRCTATHGPSGATLVTDAPVDNHGKGASFSPTDLMAAALATCTMTVMGIVAGRLGIDIEGTSVTVEKRMATEPVRRIADLPVRIRVPGRHAPEHKKRIEAAALTCPVHASLHPEINVSLRFDYPDEEGRS